MATCFHHRTGTMVVLTNGNKTASRNNPHQEFNNGLVMSSEPLQDDHLFEVRIDRKVPTWSGSIEIGVTNLDPAILDFPSSATNLRERSWVMSGTSILEDGKSQLEEYGHDLDELGEGDTVGVMRTSNGDLHFFVNGVDQGISAQQVTGTVFAVIDMYGKCAQVSIVSQEGRKCEYICVRDKLRFHELSGTMVKLSNSNRTAERKKPVDEFNNGVVMTHRPILDDELFEIRIDELVNKWSGSIEMGITSHNPDTLDFPATMTNMRSGTIMMSGCGILTNGKGSRREYGEYNLDELHEGDRIGLVCKSNKNLHYYINGLDQGVAAENVPGAVFGVVDLYGMTVKVSITDNFKPIINEPDAVLSPSSLDIPNQSPRIGLRYDDLLFHERCGVHVTVINNGRTACRPNCLDDFNNAVVITNRPLNRGEIFEVLLEQVVMKWAGTIEIGVTMHSAEELEFPSTMTNVRSGTWMMTGNGIMYNGTTISDDYGCSLDKLKAGDKIGVVVYEDGGLHFFVNGVDQGLAINNVPHGVYGVIDLYGQAAKASIVHSAESPSYVEDISPQRPSNYIDNVQPSYSQAILPPCNRKTSHVIIKGDIDKMNEITRPRGASYDPHLLYYDDGDDTSMEFSNDITAPHRGFHPVHGINISLDPNAVTATRKNDDYHHGIVFSSKHLDKDDLYEVLVYNVHTQWSGGLRFGVTTYEPENQIMLPATASIFEDSDTWLIADSHFYKNGVIIKKNYAVYYPRITAGDKIGVKVSSDDSLHFFMNGADLGTAAVNMPKALRVVADVYGSVEAITISINSGISATNIDTKLVEKKPENVASIPVEEDASMAFHENHGRNIQLSNDNLTACRIASYNQGVVISCRPLHINELFQIQIDNFHPDWSGSLQIGVTSQSPDQACLPISALSIRKETWVVSGDSVFYNGYKVKSKFGPNLETLKNKHKIGLQIDQSKNLHLYLNAIDQGIAAKNVTEPAYAIVDVYGQCTQVTITSEAYLSEDETEKDDKEKADVEYIGEKVPKPMSSSQLLSRNCDHQKLCSILKTMLGVQDSYFVPESETCFCEACHKFRGEEPYFKKGEPPKEYAQPFGWCRFPLKFATKAEKTGINEKWHVAFHGSDFCAVRRILDQGKLLPPNMLGFKVQRPGTQHGEKSKDSDDSLILITPTMLYAGSSKFSPKLDFVDSSTKKLYQAKLAFQVYVKPGSYIAKPQQLGSKDPIDSHFSNSDLEWYTKEENSIALHSLLIKVDPA